jgi:hypothetical protein
LGRGRRAPAPARLVLRLYGKRGCLLVTDVLALPETFEQVETQFAPRSNKGRHHKRARSDGATGSAP